MNQGTFSDYHWDIQAYHILMRTGASYDHGDVCGIFSDALCEIDLAWGREGSRLSKN